MSIEVCPKCAQQAFVWLEEESAHHTNVWRCCACAYQAEETEEEVAPCPRCGYRTGNLVLADGEGTHRWCSRCRTFETCVRGA